MKEWIKVVGLVLVAAVIVASSIDSLTANALSPKTIPYPNSSVNEKGDNNSIITKDEYILGEIILLNLDPIDNIDEILIINGEENYRFIGDIEDKLRFNPIKTGNYTIKITTKNRTTHSKDFKVTLSEKTKKNKVVISTDKKEYLIGETTTISLNFTSEKNYTLLIISEKSLFHYLGVPRSPLKFIPGDIGKYQIEIREDSCTLASSIFYVKSEKAEEIESKVYTNKEEYVLGENVIISSTGNITEIKIILEDESFHILNPKENTIFVPKKAGLYKIIAAFLEQNDTKEKSTEFYVRSKEEQYDYFFPLEKDVIVEVDFSDKIKAKETAIEKIFGLSPISEIKAYVENHSADNNFNLTLEKSGKNEFLVRIKNNPNIEPSIYSLLVEAKVHEETIKEEIRILWGNISKTGKNNETTVSANITKIPKIDNITKHIKHYFPINKQPIIEVDFTDEIKKPRTILEASLRKPLVEKISAYIEGQEDNSNFKIGIDHLEFDKFSIDISNEKAEKDIYKLIAVVKIDDKFLARQILFDWGIEDISELTKRININNKTTPLKNIIEITEINKTEEVITSQTNITKIPKINKAQVNKTKVNITDLTIFTDKKEYSLNEKVYIHSDADIIRLEIFSNDTHFLYTETFEKSMSFAPPKAGDYTVEATATTDGSTEILAANFYVIPNTTKANISLIPSPTKELRFLIRDSKNNEINSKTRILQERIKTITKTREKKIFFGLFTTQEIIEKEIKEYDLEIILQSQPIEKISFNNLQTPENKDLELGIEEIKKEKVDIPVKNIKNSFAIDPTKLNFSDAKVTIKAKGSELYKCKEWNFSEQKCYGEWKKIMNIVPGEEYNITITADDPAFAEIGLVAINTHKSVYLPDETVFIAIGILDHEGHVVCDANVTLIITDPSGTDTKLTTKNGDIIISDECEYLGVTDLPDYYTQYNVKGTGNYIMNITAKTYDGLPYMIDNFSVQHSVDFDVARAGPTRIYPYVPYTMNFTIKANKNYNGPIIETVPKDFIITLQNGLTITEDNENKILAWNKNLISENSYNIYYEFDAPDISPEMFYLGPLSIDDWEEARTWQIASDTTALSDTAISSNDTTVYQNEHILITSSLTFSGGGGDWNGNVWIEDDGTAIDNTQASRDFYCTGASSISVTTCDCIPGCTENEDCSVSLAGCGNQDDVVIEYLFVANGDDEPLSSDSDLQTNGDSGTFDDSITITINAALNDPPTWSNNQTNDTEIYQGENVNFSVEWNDDTSLSRYIFSSNLSGQWVNSSETAFSTQPENSTNVSCINQTSGTVIGWRFYANDSNNEWNETDIFSFTVLGITWNDSTQINLGTVEAGNNVSNFTRSIVAYGSNTNVVLACSGDCDIFDDNWSDTASMNDNTLDVLFNCSSTTAGTYSANYSISSDNDTIIDNISVICTVQDTTPPTINLESPQNDSSWDTSLNVEFKFNVSDYSGLANCTLIIDGRQNKTNDTAIYKDTTGQEIMQTLSVGKYNWSINCTDAGNNIGASVTYNVSVEQDVGAPSITVTYPTNNSYMNNNPVTLNITTNEQAICKYNNTDTTFNFTTEGTLFDDTDNTTHGTSLGNLAEGSYTYFIKCNDTFGNTNNNSNQGTITFTVDRTPPNVTLNFPNNLSNYSASNINFNWTAIDTYIDSNLTCNLTINGIINISNIDSLNNTQTNRSVYMDNGTHTWNITCWDDAGNSNTSETRLFFIDGKGPIIPSSQITTSPSIATAGTTITITANVTDTNSDVSTVYVNVTRQAAGTSFFYQMTSAGGDLYSYTFTDTSVVDTYNYFIWANDTASPNSNTNISDTKSFSIAGIESIIGIQTLNQSYKQNEYVNASSSIKYNSPNQGGGNITTTTVSEDTTTRTCSDSFGFPCNGTGDDTFDDCTSGGQEQDADIHEVHVNATNVLYTNTINITCEVDCGAAGEYIYIYYRNSTAGNWRQVFSTTCDTDTPYNESTTSNVDDVAGTHQVRCIYDRDGNSDECSESGGPGVGNQYMFDNDDVSFTVAMVDTDGATSTINYSNIGASNYTKLTDIDIDIEISSYNNTASDLADNNEPDLKISVYDGSSYSYNFTCGISSMSGFPGNCSEKISNSSILDAWQNIENRKLLIRGINIDYEDGISDYINWSGVYIELETPTKIENYGLLNLSSTLLMKVEYLNGSTWQQISVVYNQSVFIDVNETIDLSSHWNNNTWYSNTHILGAYRSYIALTDAGGTLLQNEDGTYINDTYEFNISYLKITVESPINKSVVDATNFWANITINDTYYSSGGWCGYSLDGAANITMDNDSSIHFYNSTAHTTIGQHNITFYCNDTDGDISYERTTFNAADQTGPTVNLQYPAPDQEGLPLTITFKYNVTDIVSNISNCSLYIDSKLKKTNTTVKEGVSQNFTYTFGSGGVYDWRIDCYDNSSDLNKGQSPARDFIVGSDSEPPEIYLGNPPDNNLTSKNDIIFFFGVYDALSDIDNCSLILNGKVNSTKNTSEIIETAEFANDDNNFTIDDMPLGQYNWSINCTDSSNNHKTSQSNIRNLTIIEDTDNPGITLSSPAIDAKITSSGVDFKYIVNDATSGIRNCSLFINGTWNASVLNPAEGKTNTFTVTGFGEGIYNWSINCTDDSFQGNSNISETRNFTIILLQNINVSISTDKITYEQGTQINDTINITSKVTDQLDNPLDSNVTTDIINTNTSLRWWNHLWKRRKPIYLNGTSSAIEGLIEVNVTGLNGYISSCTNEIRIIKNSSFLSEIITFNIKTGDDSNWCYVLFNATITANAVNENNYFVYFNNSAASNPNHARISVPDNKTYDFNTSTKGEDRWAYRYEINGKPPGSASIPSTEFSSINYTNIETDNEQFQGDSTTTNGNYAAHRFVFNISENRTDITKIEVLWNGYGTHDNGDNGAALYIWNYTSSSAKVLETSSVAAEVNLTGTITSSLNIISAENLITIIAEQNDAQAVVGQVRYSNIFTDYISLNISYNRTASIHPNISSLGDTEVLINRSINETGDSGIFKLNLNSGSLDTGWYSAVSWATSSGYNNATNFTSFRIIIDQTAPIVNLVSPANNNISTINSITFYYNASDSLSAIANCSLIINNSINQTNSSITEDIKLNFTLNSLPNGDYMWSVNCTDNSGNQNTGDVAARKLTIALDEEAPKITLISPVKGWNDTDGNITFFFNFSDQYTSTADCYLYINGTLNDTKENLLRDTTQNFTVSNFADADYYWHINCTDDSSGRNSNLSESRNFSVAVDTTPPAIMIIFPAEVSQSTTGNVSFIVNVSDLNGIANCSLIINGTINQTNITNTTNSQISTINFTVNGIPTGSYIWNVACFDNSENKNENTTLTRNLTVGTDTKGPVIYLEYPDPASQFIATTITFRYNASDFASGISNCSLIINGTINQTNKSIQEGISQNFTVNGFAFGDYTWQVNCTDDSTWTNTNSSEIRSFSIGKDTTPPIITLEYPPNSTYVDSDGNITFLYKVDDFATDIANCSIIIDGKLNQTNTTAIFEDTSGQNFTVGGIPNGTHTWRINCTDTSLTPNIGNSSLWIFKVNIDEVGPQITLNSPVNMSLDTDGNVEFSYTVNDIISGIRNCSLIINGEINQTNTSAIAEGSPETFTLNDLPDGIYNWSINCTDDSDNLNENSSEIRILNVTVDNAAPVVNLVSPGNNTLDTDGIRTFSYNVTDQITNVSECSLIFNGVVEITNTSIQEGVAQYFTLTDISTGQYDWNVNCTDASENANVNSSEIRNFTEIRVSSGPTINLEQPGNNTQDKDSRVIFTYNVSHPTAIINCSLIINETINQTNSSITTDKSLNFTIDNMPSGTYVWYINCTENSEDNYTNSSEKRLLIVGVDADAPLVYLEEPNESTSYIHSTLNNIVFRYNVTDFASGISNCSLIINNTINQSNSTGLTEDTSLNFTVYDFAIGDYTWQINCTDDSSANNTGVSETRNFTVRADSSPPKVYLEEPENDTLSITGNIVLRYNVTDPETGIYNCSLIINGTINQTNSTIEEGKSQNFTLSSLANGNYTWRINCTNNATFPITGNSTEWAFTVGVDITPPVINLISPTNNTRSVSQNIFFYYNVSDRSSNVSNCSLIINGEVNVTDTEIEEEVTLNFTLYNMAQGSYNWSINCTDAAENPNIGKSKTYNLTIRLADTLLVNTSTDNSSYEKGDKVQITTNVTNNESIPIITSVAVDIIKGNATSPWWNTSWRYRIPIKINSTNITRINSLIEAQVNFTDILINELILLERVFDQNSIRVIEWADNNSYETPSQFDNISDYDNSNNAFGDVIWIMNSTTTTNTIRYYYIYFDTTDNSKQSPGYSKPDYSFGGSGKTINYDSTDMDASRLSISHKTESFTLQFDKGNLFENFDYAGYAGAGSLWNITINGTLITNPYSAIAPLIIQSEDYLDVNAASIVESGPVVTKVRILGNISTIKPSEAELNYTIWFGESEIMVRADLFAYFGTAEAAPIVRYQNEWFAYMLSNNSDWENYIYNAKSETMNRTHVYNSKTPAGHDTLYTSTWYTEHDDKGSINVYAETFKQNNIDETRKVIIYNDGYVSADNPAPESDSVGFNFDETSIDAGSNYSMTVWMIFSYDTTSQRARDLKEDICTPPSITQLHGERLVTQDSGDTDSEGIFYNNWSSVNQSIGWYSAVGYANKTYYKKGFDYALFKITKDTVIPYVQLGNPSGWLNYSNVTFSFLANDSNLVVSNCTVILNDKRNVSSQDITNNEWDSITVYGLPDGIYNWTINCSDPTSNIGTASEKTIYIDTAKPDINLSAPINNSNFTISTTEFNFSVTDNMDENISCIVYIDETNEAAVNASNNTLTNVTVYDIGHAVHHWKVTCTDKAGNSNTSETWVFTTNLYGTAITLVSPLSPANWDNDGNVTFIYQPTSISPILNCSIIINGIVNQTNDSITGGADNIFTVAGIPEGEYNWSINCTDYSLRTANSSQETLYIDETNPEIVLNHPGEGETIENSTIDFNFTVTDNMDTELNCNITLDGKINNTESITAANGTPETYSISGLSDGIHYWNITCIDEASNSNISLTYNFTAGQPPSITLVEPEQEYWNNDGNISFIYYVSDNNGLTNCSLIIDEVFNKTNETTLTNNANNTINLTGINEGTYNWSINCTDTSGNIGSSSTARTFYVDKTKPTVNLSRPESGAVISGYAADLNFTVIDNMDSSLECNLTLDGSVQNSNPISADNGSITHYQASAIEDGTHYWNVTCWDNASNSNTSLTWNFEALVPPIVSLISPPDWHLNSTANITFFYNVTDLSGIANCSLIFNGELNKTNSTTVLVNSPNNFTLDNIEEGIHTWTVNCTDNTGLEGTGTARTIYIDKTPPDISLDYPANNSLENMASFSFNFTVTDNVAADLECNLTLNGKVNNTIPISAANGTVTAYQITDVYDGIYSWNVTCWDNLSNTNTSETWNFTVGVAPNATLLTPVNETWFSTDNVTVTYNASDLFGVANCSLYFDGSLNQTNTTIQNHGSNNFTLANMGEGAHTWYIRCIDSGNLIGYSEEWTMYIDTVAPEPFIRTANGTNFTDSAPKIEFNITDGLSPTINYTFIIDYTILNTNGTAAANVTTYDNLSNLDDGTYNITLLAIDKVGNKKNSSTIHIRIDTQAPAISIQNPGIDEVLGFTIYLQTTISDDGIGLDQASYTLYNSSGYYYQNGSLNSSDSFDAQWDSRNDINDADDTIYVYFNITANDTLGNTNSQVIRFIVDNKNPSITFTYPDGNYVNSNFNLSILIQNDHLNISYYNITDRYGNLKDNNSNNSIGWATFSWTDLINITDTGKYPDGYYNITVYANDSVGNNRTSSNFFIIDRVAPAITLEMPIGGYNTSTTSITFNFTVNDSLDGNLTCNLSIDGVVMPGHNEFNAENASTINRTVNGLSQGTQYWNVTCWDDAGNINVSLTRQFTVDTSSPTISLAEPEDNYWNNTGNITFIYTPSDTYTSIANCSLVINGEINQTNTTIIESTQNNFTIYNLNEGEYNWTINCTDTVGNIGSNGIRTLYIDWTSPTVSITTNNNTWFNDPTPEISFNIIDNLDPALNYTFYIDYTTQSTNGTAASNTISSDNLSSLKNGTYVIILEAWDEINAKVNSTPITIYIDTVKPAITLQNPENNSNTTQNIDFNFTVTDNMDTNMACNLTIDGKVNKSNIQAENGSITNITVLGIPNGYHNWSIACIDNASNTQTSTSWYFNVTPPDLFINGTEIDFNNTSPREGENITINAAIRNIGTADAGNVIVQFFDGDPDNGGTQIEGDKTINVGYGSYVVTNVTWIAGIGTHYIFVKIDPYDSIIELDEDNNKANRSITISSWHTVYGRNVGDLVIRDLSNRTVFSWYVSNASSGNVFAADYDSSITWSNLTAIGRNISGSIMIDDFEEIDTVLNSTGYIDSVNRTYTVNSTSKNTASFIIFTSTIANISIANSTNTSNFITGILWDKSDDTNSQYNGTQDIVFASKINPDKQGKYGIYDYEIRVPSELKKYKTTNIQSVVFYAELR